MGIIKVETPQGIKEVEIAGDTPTEQEQQALFNTFFAETPQAQTDLDFSTASIEEIQNYARQKELAGIDAATGQPIDPTTQPVGDLKDPDVDYTSGVKDFGLRTKLGTFELPEEKAAYLEDRVGKEGFRHGHRCWSFIIWCRHDTCSNRCWSYNGCNKIN
jgi:hypothetical protein